MKDFNKPKCTSQNRTLRKNISNQTSWHKNYKNILKQYVSKLSCSSAPSTLKEKEGAYQEGVTAPHHRSFGSGRSKKSRETPNYWKPRVPWAAAGDAAQWFVSPTVSSHVKKTMKIHNLRAQGGHVKM